MCSTGLGLDVVTSNGKKAICKQTNAHISHCVLVMYCIAAGPWPRCDISFIHPSIRPFQSGWWLQRQQAGDFGLHAANLCLPSGNCMWGKADAQPDGNPSFDLGLTFFFQQLWCHGTVTKPWRDPRLEQPRTTHVAVKVYSTTGNTVAIFRTLQRCSIGFRSGLWLGHSRKHTRSCPETTPWPESRFPDERWTVVPVWESRVHERKVVPPNVHVSRCTFNPLNKV